MAPTDSVKAKARTAYELGRLRRALRFSVLPLPLIAISMNLCGAPVPVCITGGLLIAVIVFLAWRGESYEAAILPGLAAGLSSFALPFGAELFNACNEERMFLCASLCFLGGVITGAFLGARCLREALHRRRFLVSGCVIASLVGSLGCVLAGLGGVMGMVLGVTTISIPTVLLVRRA